MRIEPDAIRAGFRDVRWEGRLEAVSERPLVVLDGAHNPASVRKLADSIGPVFSGRYERLILVLGVLADKDFRSMYDMLSPFADEVIFTKAAYERALPPSELMKVAGAGCEPKVTGTVADALELAMGVATPADMVLVTGSLYVIGEAKAHIGDKKLFLRA
jgi:dihydrofolate synthase/folylpolyglutamate synthase